jgi:hypothetical protein
LRPRHAGLRRCLYAAAYFSGEFDNTTEKVDHAAELDPTLGKQQLRRYGGV